MQSSPSHLSYTTTAAIVQRLREIPYSTDTCELLHELFLKFVAAEVTRQNLPPEKLTALLELRYDIKTLYELTRASRELTTPE